MARRSGLGRIPSRETTAADLLTILGHLETGGVGARLDGGWAVDAALGLQTRPHYDLDLVVELAGVEQLVSILAHDGYEAVSGGAPRSFELIDAAGHQVDVHPVALTPAGDGRYVMDSDEIWIYPAASFEGEGAVLGRRVRCLTPAVQLLCHTGYEPHRTSYDDVHALCRRFGLDVPDEYARPRETYRVRTAMP